MSEEKKPNILIVEDNKILVATYQQMFQSTRDLRAYNLVLYESAWLALEWLNSAKEEDLPCAAVLDWVMEGMNGMDLVEAMKKNPLWKGIPIIMVTSTSQRAKVVLACTAGVDDYLLKPIQTKLLVKKLQILLGKAEPLPTNPVSAEAGGAP